MDALEAIFTRQSFPTLLPDPVPQELIKRLLASAVQAPNHYVLRPWRFVVLQGQARERLGELFARLLHERQPDLPEAAFEKERAKPLRAPVLIAVGVARSDDPRSNELENICATAAAVENLLLAAHALGLGAMWRTGKPAFDPSVKEFLGLDPAQPLIGFIYLGYPAAERPPVDRASFADRTTWLE
ncbi:MAG TPA: nitroreductase [Anaerolineaceae bacterium]|nr:nitroreductase [Anaerolineaceae bacterium]